MKTHPHHEDSDWKQVENFKCYLVCLLIITYVSRWQIIGSIFPRINKIDVSLFLSLETLMMNEMKSLVAQVMWELN